MLSDATPKSARWLAVTPNDVHRSNTLRPSQVLSARRKGTARAAPTTGLSLAARLQAKLVAAEEVEQR